MKSTGMLCCWLKILYYIVLISYHVCDVVFDWRNYFELSANRSFSGYEELLFCLSISVGLFTSLCMIVVYGYYIKFHGECIYRGCLGYKLLPSCNLHFNDFELLFSILELLGKDGIQSYILYRFYKSHAGILQEPTCNFVIFALCSLAAHSKLGTCFSTKLCGCGVGERSCCNLKVESDLGDKVFKAITCFIGFISSLMCLILTIMSITDGFQTPGHIFTSVEGCFYAAGTKWLIFDQIQSLKTEFKTVIRKDLVQTCSDYFKQQWVTIWLQWLLAIY